MTIFDPMDSTEFRVDHVMYNLHSTICDLEALRRSNDARRFLQEETADIEVCRDRLSRILDDVGGK